MGDDKTGALFLREDTLPELPFGFDIEGAGKIVEDQQFGCTCKHTCSGCTLYLPTGKLDASGSNYRLQAIHERFHISLHDRNISGLLNLAIGERQTERDVLPQGRTEQSGRLRRIGTTRRHKETARIVHLCAIPEYFTLLFGQ